MFSSNGLLEASIITEVHPASIHFLMTSRSLQWSRWSTAGTDEFSASCLYHPATGSNPQKSMVLTEVWMMTGAFSSSALSITARIEP